MMRNRRTRRTKMGLRGILPLALLAGGVMLLVRRNRSMQNRSSQHHMGGHHISGHHNPMDYDTQKKLQREVEILEDADNRMFDNFPQD